MVEINTLTYIVAINASCLTDDFFLFSVYIQPAWVTFCCVRMKRQLTPQLFEAVDHHNRGSFTEVHKEHLLLQVYTMLSRLRGVVLELFTQNRNQSPLHILYYQVTLTLREGLTFAQHSEHCSIVRSLSRIISEALEDDGLQRMVLWQTR